MDKRGVSEIVATVLIIVIVVAAVGLLWAFLSPLMKENLSSVDCSMIDISIPSNLEYTCYEPSKLMMVQVSKGSSDLEIGAIKFYVLSGGNEIRYQKNVNFSSGQKVFYLDTSRFSSIEEIKVIPVVGSGRSQRSCGEISLKSPPSCKISEVFGNEIPVNEIIPENSVSNSDGTTDVDKLWYYDKECDGYGNGSSISKAYRPSFAGCINTTQEVLSVSTKDWNDNDKYCHGQEVCNARNGLVAYWPMDEIVENKVIDYFQLNYNGTCSTCPIVQPGKINNSYSFNTSSLSFQNMNLNQNFSISLWVKPYSRSPIWRSNVLVKETYIQRGFRSGVNDQGGYSFWSTQSINIGGGFDASTPAGSLPLNIFTHVAMVYNGTTAFIYLNGMLNATSNGNFVKPNTGDALLIGGGSGLDNFNGSLDEVAIFNRSLNATEISAFYNSGSGFKLKD
jgi:flagellin-like protein